jgi:catechol 2,3-dioxygenase-like lactoylglutathione lyase family enzyme
MVSFLGVHHGGIGVSDMETSLQFYGGRLGFSEVLFDYTGPLPGMERVTGWPETTARVVFLANPNRGPLGVGQLKLVQLLAPQGPGPIPEGFHWGELGISEVSINVHGGLAVMEELKQQGCKELMPMDFGPLPPSGTDCGYGYVEDPDGSKVEFIEWRGACPMIDPRPRIEGLNHVAFGVLDLKRTWTFYEPLGFTQLVFDYSGVLDAMTPWFGEPTEQHLMMKFCPPGAGIEPVEHPNDERDCRGSWGRLSAFEFAIEVTNIDVACAHFRQQGIELLSDPQTIAVNGSEWKYVYFVEPDNLFVSLIEPRF